MVKKQQQKTLKRTISPFLLELGRYKYAKPNEDLTLKKKYAGKFTFEVNLKSGTRNKLIEKSVVQSLSNYLDCPPFSPFIIDRPVTGSDFLNYRTEIEWALKEIQTYSTVILFGASGFGKTSVALALKEKLKIDNDLVVGYVSLRGATSEWDLVKRYVEAMFRAMGIPDYRWELINESNFDKQFLVNCYDLPTNYAKRLGKKLIAIVDDFDAVDGIKNGEIIENRFRGAWQADFSNQQHISAIIFQNISNEALLARFKKRGLAYKGTSRFFERIPVDQWVTHLREKFNTDDKSIEESVMVYLIGRMNQIPRKIKTLCHHLYRAKPKVITRQLVDQMIDRLLDNVSWIYEARLGYLSELQQAVLYSYADKTEFKVPAPQHSRITRCMDEFVFYQGSERIFRDPFLEVYILKRNKVRVKNPKNRTEFTKIKKTGSEENFDNKEWTWE